jgi:hypothetical protein
MLRAAANGNNPRLSSDRGRPVNCDVLPLNIEGASRFLRKWPLATLDVEPPEALWPETKGQAASLARKRAIPTTVRASSGDLQQTAGQRRGQGRRRGNGDCYQGS